MILATSSLFDLNLPKESKISRKYYALARACLAWNPTASVAMVQALFLMVTFLMHSEKATVGGEASWPLLRLAVAACQSIGLHRDGANWNLRLEDQVEERRRVFWEINAYDIQQSISLGRPRGMCCMSSVFPLRPPVVDIDLTSTLSHVFGDHRRSLPRCWQVRN